ARKILNRGDPVFGPPVKLARDVEQLRPYVRSAREVIEAMLAQGRLVMLEGTQGTELSIHHGRYPHVTSRETSSSGCLADAGVSFDVVRDVIMVVRTYPIRVGGPSGAMGQVIDFETIQERSNIPIEEFDKTERGTVSGRKRRVAEFDWARIRRSAQLNGATKIALTFADYFGVENREATDYASLNEQTQAFIRKLEMVTGVPVAYVSKAFAKDGVLEKGTWT
ncbi:MAG TPA: adenylosuccinate synthase, partial [Erythrobacter sp.]|nr:adenylosuccinate synthase [Erythrobacter sp.]